MNRVTLLLRLLLVWAIVGFGGGALCVAEGAKITFDDHVSPIFREKCAACHNGDKRSGGLDLTNFTGLMEGGSSGEVIEPGDASGSYLYLLITHESEPVMPLEAPKMPDATLEIVRAWIDGGALENSGSQALAKNNTSAGLAMAGPSIERPQVPAMPPRMSLEPVQVVDRTTAVAALAVSPWSPLVAVAAPKQVLLYQAETLELLGILPFPEGMPQVLKFSRNGNLLLAGGGRHAAQGKAVVWDVKTGARILEIGDELDTVLAADISSDQTLIALAGPGRVVRVYSTETGQLNYECRKHTDWIYTLEFSPDAVLLASGDRSGGLFVWEAWTGREYLTLKGHSQGVTDVSWRLDSNLLASGSEDGSIRLWEMEGGGQIKTWNAHGGVASVEFTRDGRLASCGRDRQPRVWDQNGRQQQEYEAFPDLALEVAFCNETGRLIAGDWVGNVYVFDAEEAARIGQLSTAPPALATRLSAAENALQASQLEFVPLAAARDVARQALAQVEAELAEAITTRDQAKSSHEQAKVRRDALRHTVTTTRAAITAAERTVAALTPGDTALAEAANYLQTAAAANDTDQELAQLAARVQAVADERAQQLAAGRQTLAESPSLLEAASQALPAAEQAVSETEPPWIAAGQQVERLTALVEQVSEQVATTGPPAAAAEVELAATQEKVERWRDEIEFAAKLATLQQRRRDFEAGLTDAEIQLAERTRQVDAAREAVERARAELAAADAEIEAAQGLSADATNTATAGQ